MKTSIYYLQIILLIIGIASCVKNETDQKNKNATDSLHSDIHNSRNSLDWQGAYETILPCADCEGIQTVLRINENMSYSVFQKYLGKEGEAWNKYGRFSWDDSGNSIQLDDKMENRRLKVGENVLLWLDNDGQVIKGALADKYKLNRIPHDGLMEKYWKLINIGTDSVKVYGNRKPYLILKADNKQFNGHSGCNTFSGAYELELPNRIRFSKITSTEMACPVLDMEHRYLEALNSADHYSVRNDTLRLGLADDPPLATFVAVYFK